MVELMKGQGSFRHPRPSTFACCACVIRRARNLGGRGGVIHGSNTFRQSSAALVKCRCTSSSEMARCIAIQGAPSRAPFLVQRPAVSMGRDSIASICRAKSLSMRAVAKRRLRLILRKRASGEAIPTALVHIDTTDTFVSQGSNN